jgi:hypothetical protein
MFIRYTILLLLVLEQKRNIQQGDFRHQKRPSGYGIAAGVDAPPGDLGNRVLLAAKLRI